MNKHETGIKDKANTQTQPGLILQELLEHSISQYKVSIFVCLLLKLTEKKNQENNTKEIFMFMSHTAIHFLNI